NLYSNDAYYYVMFGGSSGKRMQTYTEPSGAATVTYTDYIARVFDEKKLENIVQLSRKTFGENYDQSFNKQVVLQTSMLNSSKQATNSINVASISHNSTSYNVSLNNQPIETQIVGQKAGDVLASETYLSNQRNLSGETNNINITFNNNDVPSGRG